MSQQMVKASIQSVDLLRLKVPLHTPFKTAVREVTHIDDLVVRICASDGSVGYGSAPSTPQITGDDHASIQAALETSLIPLVLNQDLDDFERLVSEIQWSANAGSNAKAAMDIALFDVYARSKGLPLYALINSIAKAPANLGSRERRLETDYTISVNHVEQMCKDIDIAVARNYRCLKIKIGNQPELDLHRLKIIHGHTQQLKDKDIHLSLRLDVNQGWDVQTTITIMQQLEHLGIDFELVEQPIVAHDINGLAMIKAVIKTPLMADESAFNLEQVMQLDHLNAADIINIKLIKAGGIYPAMQIADYCRQHQLKCMIGCMLEGSIGVAAAAHLAFAYADVITLIDLDGPTLGKYDPIEGATLFNDARIQLNDTPGLGISSSLPKWSTICIG